MARPYRLQAENSFYHITSRGNDRKPIYKSERDYGKFLEYLSVAKEKFKFYVHAYCLMINHYHLFIETSLPNISRIMQYINTAYTIYHNVKHKKSGHLFQGRYKSIIVEQDAYFTELTRYIHLNPVRAKIVNNPADYRWSSYKAYIKGKSDGYVDIDRVKEFIDMKLADYRGFVEASKAYPDPFKKVYAGFMLGGVKFIKEKLNQLRIDVESKDFAHKRAIKNTIEPESIIEAVAKYYRIEPEKVWKSISRPMTVKKTAIYLIRKKTGLTNGRIGEIFKMKRSAISKAAKNFELELRRNKSLRAAVERVSSTFEV